MQTMIESLGSVLMTKYRGDCLTRFATNHCSTSPDDSPCNLALFFAQLLHTSINAIY